MKTFLGIIILFFSIFIICSSSFAGELAYACKVTHVYDHDADGSLKTSSFEKQLKGGQFQFHVLREKLLERLFRL